MKFTHDEAIDQLNRLYKYSGASFQAALFTDAMVNQLTTVDAATDTFTSTAHTLINGCRVTFSSTASLPSPLITATTYYVINATTNTYQLAATKGGSVIDILDNGSGAISVIEQPPNAEDSLDIWLRLESNYQGSGRQTLSFAGLSPQINTSKNWAEFPEIIATFKPLDASINYRYFGVVGNGKLKFEDYGSTQTIPMNFPLGFSYQAILPLGT